jgi:hypothetical protein
VRHEAVPSNPRTDRDITKLLISRGRSIGALARLAPAAARSRQTVARPEHPAGVGG